MENFKINPFVIKSVLESYCKRFRKSAKRENFNQKSEAQKKKTHSSNWANYAHQYNEVKEKLKPVSFIYVWTIFEHQVKDIFAIQKPQVLSNLRSPLTNIRHDQGHQRPSASTGSMNINQNRIMTVYKLESQKTVNAKLWKRTNWFSEVMKEIFYHNFRES